ncbi:apical membrane antigen 1 [Babesia ovis]|uniref:Apical membrane antigen 1 n=1 Tax=Babesia ovis TaxID=5869 RepID=A0A9W5WUW7_BABOV|nr:apical membrane antigen 1 [Babesia ovis]
MLTVDPNERDGPGMPSVRGFSRYGSTSVGSIRGIAMSFASTEYGGTGSFDTGVTVRDVLSRRYTAESRAEGLRKFRNDPSQHTIYNSKRLGIVLLLLSMINICLFVVLQVRRSSHAECTINIPDDSSNVNGVWDSQISKKDCIGDISRFEQADTVHVYYTINNYPFHGASVFRLHSKEQIEGKEVSKDDIKNCFPYDIVHVDGKEQIIYPCGPHIWHLYNDSFKFSTKQYSTSSLVPVALDESQELLAQRQEFAIARNPPDQEISRSYKNTYYWLQSNAKEITAHEKPKRVGEKVDSTTMLKKTVHQLRATEKLMAAHKAGTARRSHDGTSDTSERYSGRNSASQTPWTKYMQKFDIPRVHGSGIFVDLGGYETVEHKSYRMPVGKCPVMGKVIDLGNGADFLEPISSEDPKYRGLAFPETAVDASTTPSRSRTRSSSSAPSLSPVSAFDLRRWGYNGNDVANCAEYANNLIPASDRNTKYRYPFVYDSNEEMCYILYSAIQYNQGKRYCDNDGSQDEGKSSLLCMRPYKSVDDAHLYYGSAKVDPDWESNCPMNPVRDAMFGKWSGGSCVASTPAFVEYVNSAEDCASLLFDNSSTDLDIDVSKETYDEVEDLVKGIKTLNIYRVARAIFSPLAKSAGTSRISRGVGMNWANYNSDDGACAIINETPNCLVLNAGSLALTAIGSPLEQDAVNFPCHIDTNGYVEPRARNTNRYSNSAFEVTTSSNIKTLKCSAYVHAKYSSSCGTYYYCSNVKPSLFRRFLYMLGLHSTKRIILAILTLVGLTVLIIWAWHRFLKTKEGPTKPSFDRYMSKYEYDDSSEVTNETEQRLTSDAYVWGEAASRPSDVTPVHLSKIN